MVPSAGQGPKRTVNSEYFCEVLKTLFKHIAKKKRLELKKKFILHHNNTRPHTSSRMIVYLTKHSIKVMDHPPYNPDLALCDFWLFHA